MQRRKPKKEKVKKEKSKFISLCMWTIGLLLLISPLLVFAIFRTSVLFDIVDDDKAISDLVKRVSVSTVIVQVEDEDNPPDDSGTPTNPTIVNNTFSVLGDSISTYENCIPSGYPYYYPDQNADVNSADDTWWGMFEKDSGYTHDTINSYSGSMVSKTDDSAGQSNARTGNLGTNPGLIIVYMGTNDILDGVNNSDFESAYDTMLSKIKSNYSSAKLVCVSLLYMKENTTEFKPDDYNSIISKLASKHGAQYVDIQNIMDLSAGDMSNLAHPNKSGMRKIADAILGKTGKATTPNNPTPPGVNPTPGTVLSPDAVEKAVYQKLKSMGYCDEAIAGVMGNMKHESGMIPGATYGHGHDNQDSCVTACRGKTGPHGLVQWTSGRRDTLFDLAVSQGKSWYDIDIQLAYFESEINGSEKNNGSPSAIINRAYSGDDLVEFATYKFAKSYERCGGASKCNDFSQRDVLDGWSQRSQYARDYYATIKAGGF